MCEPLTSEPLQLNEPSAEYFIRTLHMQPHMEGGFFSENLTSSRAIDAQALDAKYADAKRPLWTSIYFLLCKDNSVSRLHRLRSEEIWYFHCGSALSVVMLNPATGQMTTGRLGLRKQLGEEPQVLVPAGMIFGSILEEGSFSLVGCMVSPGFDYNDFEVLPREALLAQFPQHQHVIRRVT